jgi:hypothetical protein
VKVLGSRLEAIQSDAWPGQIFKGGFIMIITHYKKLHGELEGKFSVHYTDEGIHGTLYATSLFELYRATRFLSVRTLDRVALFRILEDKHGEERKVA